MEPQYTMLLVDDEPVLRTAVTRFLRKEPITFIEASDGQEGLDIYKNNPDSIDIILTDYQMRVSGIYLAKKIREINPDIPIILQTGVKTHDEVLENKDLFNAILGKPYNRNELVETVYRELGYSPNSQ